MMPVYNKLVRDKIPEIISKSGKSFTTRVLDEDEYKLELQKKLKEEFHEYLIAETQEEVVEELADMLELLYALTAVHGTSVKQLYEKCEAKAEKNGKFQKKIMLIEVADE